MARILFFMLIASLACSSCCEDEFIIKDNGISAIIETPTAKDDEESYRKDLKEIEGAYNSGAISRLEYRKLKLAADEKFGSARKENSAYPKSANQL